MIDNKVYGWYTAISQLRQRKWFMISSGLCVNYKQDEQYKSSSNACDQAMTTYRVNRGQRLFYQIKMEEISVTVDTVKEGLRHRHPKERECSKVFKK